MQGEALWSDLGESKQRNSACPARRLHGPAGTGACLCSTPRQWAPQQDAPDTAARATGRCMASWKSCRAAGRGSSSRARFRGLHPRCSAPWAASCVGGRPPDQPAGVRQAGGRACTAAQPPALRPRSPPGARAWSCATPLPASWKRSGSPNSHSWPCSKYSTGAVVPSSHSGTCTRWAGRRGEGRLRRARRPGISLGTAACPPSRHQRAPARTSAVRARKRPPGGRCPPPWRPGSPQLGA